MNEYKGYTWTTLSGLSVKLGKKLSYVSGLISRHPEMTVQDIIDRVLGKEYRGIKWHTRVELSEKLGLNKSAAFIWLKRNPTKTEYDFIDYNLGKEYKGFVWKNKHQLSLALKEDSTSNIYRFFKIHPEKSEEDYIDYVLEKRPIKSKENMTYKGISWSTKRDLSRQFGKCETYAGTWLCRNKDKTIYDLIDILLEEKESA